MVETARENQAQVLLSRIASNPSQNPKVRFRLTCSIAERQLPFFATDFNGHRVLISRERHGLLASELRRKFLSGMYNVQDDVGVVTNLNEYNIR
jgi:hypothetical protein